MSLDDYQQEADSLFAALQAGDRDAHWRVKWEHPRFRGKSIVDVHEASLSIDDARTVVARQNGFEDWADLVAFVSLVATDAGVARFESAVDAVISGDIETLRPLLREHPELAHARSSRRHHATLLHYIAANGVEGSRQKTPPNAVEIAKLLLDAGAEPDALADMYDAKCNTMSMLVSSSHPAEAGLQTALAETLLDHGAALEGAGTSWQSHVLTALVFGYLGTAEMLAKRGAPLSFTALAGLGRADDVAKMLPQADAESRQTALAVAAQHGQVPVVQLLLDAGESPDRYNPDGFHAHATPLHQAVAAGHLEVVKLLVSRGARLDLEDKIYFSTPGGWASYLGKDAIAEYLESK